MFDPHKFSPQPKYHTKANKIKARAEVIRVYRELTGYRSIPSELGYWTLCNRQPNEEGAEIVQLVNAGLIQKNQFYGVDNDVKDEGIIEDNCKEHPEAHWFKGDWLEVIDEHYDQFKPSLVYFDYTQTVANVSCRICLARTLNCCLDFDWSTVVVANIMITDGHSKRWFDPHGFLDKLAIDVRETESHSWNVYDRYYEYKASQTNMASYVFMRN